VRLTAHALDLLERARPLVADLRALAEPTGSEAGSHFSLALADSIAASWGPAVIGRALQALSGIGVHLHAHRSVLLLENVRLGRYHIGLSTELPPTRDLIHYPVVEEPLVLVNSGARARSSPGQALISIEPSSATWRAIEPQLRVQQPQLLERRLLPVETFSATVQMVKAGFGDGLVPLGIAIEMHLDRRCYREVAGVRRRISLVTRKTVNQLAGFQRLREQLVMEAQRYFAAAARPGRNGTQRR
jgi:DNA-binding transcriptional LysR family regulator